MVINPDWQENVKAFQTSIGRFYKLPSGELVPSVSTISGKSNKGKQIGLNNWRKKVGLGEANKITKQSSERGSKVHKAIEVWLENRKPGEQPSREILDCLTSDEELKCFARAYTMMDRAVKKVYLVEAAVYNSKYGFAGRLDLAADWEGVPAIIDLKTKRKFTPKQYLADHFYQLAAYAFALNNHLKQRNIDLRFNRCVIVPVNPHGHQDPYVIDVRQVRDYWDGFKSFLTTFRQEYGPTYDKYLI